LLSNIKCRAPTKNTTPTRETFSEELMANHLDNKFTGLRAKEGT